MNLMAAAHRRVFGEFTEYDKHLALHKFLQMEKLGTHGRVPEIYTNIYHRMVLWGNMV